MPCSDLKQKKPLHNVLATWVIKSAAKLEAAFVVLLRDGLQLPCSQVEAGTLAVDPRQEFVDIHPACCHGSEHFRQVLIISSAGVSCSLCRGATYLLLASFAGSSRYVRGDMSCFVTVATGSAELAA